MAQTFILWCFVQNIEFRKTFHLDNFISFQLVFCECFITKTVFLCKWYTQTCTSISENTKVCLYAKEGYYRARNMNNVLQYRCLFIHLMLNIVTEMVLGISNWSPFSKLQHEQRRRKIDSYLQRHKN